MDGNKVDVFDDSTEDTTSTVSVITFCDVAAAFPGSISCVNFVFRGFLTRSCEHVVNVLLY